MVESQLGWATRTGLRFTVMTFTGWFSWISYYLSSYRLRLSSQLKPISDIANRPTWIGNSSLLHREYRILCLWGTRLPIWMLITVRSWSLYPTPRSVTFLAFQILIPRWLLHITWLARSCILWLKDVPNLEFSLVADHIPACSERPRPFTQHGADRWLRLWHEMIEQHSME